MHYKHKHTKILIIFFPGIKSADLKKGFFGKPSPYIKINVFPRVRHAAAAQKHHGFQGKSTVKQGSADPVWEKEVNIMIIIDLYQFVINNH